MCKKYKSLILTLILILIINSSVVPVKADTTPTLTKEKIVLFFATMFTFGMAQNKAFSGESSLVVAGKKMAEGLKEIEDTVQIVKSKAGYEALAFTLKGLSLYNKTLTDYKGKATIINEVLDGQLPLYRGSVMTVDKRGDYVKGEFHVLQIITVKEISRLLYSGKTTSEGKQSLIMSNSKNYPFWIRSGSVAVVLNSQNEVCIADYNATTNEVIYATTISDPGARTRDKTYTCDVEFKLLEPSSVCADIKFQDALKDVPVLKDKSPSLPVDSDLGKVANDFVHSPTRDKVIDGVESIPITDTGTNTGTNTGTLDMSIPNDIKLDFSPLYLDLSTKFPFCIPFDIVRVIKSVVVPSKEPKFIIPFKDTGWIGGEDVEIEFSMFSKLIKFVRYGFLLGFLWFLIIKTRELIRG